MTTKMRLSIPSREFCKNKNMDRKGLSADMIVDSDSTEDEMLRHSQINCNIGDEERGNDKFDDVP